MLFANKQLTIVAERFVNEKDELVISNPMYKKLDLLDKTGIGLANLSDRFRLLLNKEIRVESKNDVFNVYLPLNERL